MPKLIDNYVLSRKIGSGQYGEVYRGYDRATNNDIAVKSIKRDSVKGKFKQLLESQIKVLKSCESPNIIKLYDVKKTPNNFYLVMEFCDDGDLDAYLKKRKYLTEEEAIEILCEVIHGFQHLHKHKIIHRDLKLANLLRHDGIVKIADFGFSKILGEDELTKTMLGSPLNMAPQVLNNNQYSSQADIYSLGVCYYWILFGKPPFNAKNVIQLKEVINKQQILFPKKVNSISQMSKNLIRSMLKPDPKERITWQQLFKHQINSYLNNLMENQLKLTLTMEGSFSENMCKLYLRQNLVIIHPCEFKKREEMMQYAVQTVQAGNKKQFKGSAYKTKVEEIGGNPHLKRQEVKEGDPDRVTEDQKITTDIYNNTFLLLNERNKIIFLLSIMNEIRLRKERKYLVQVLSGLVTICNQYYEALSTMLSQKQNIFNLNSWAEFLSSPQFKNLQHFLRKQQKIMKYQLDNSKEKCNKVKIQPSQLPKYISLYSKTLIDSMKGNEHQQKHRPEWIHISHLIDITELDDLMTKQFDFKHYYCEFGKYEMKELVERITKRL